MGRGFGEAARTGDLHLRTRLRCRAAVAVATRLAAGMIVATATPGAAQDPSHHRLAQMPVQEGRIPFDMTVDAYHVEAVDRFGNRVPQVVIHHFNLLDPTDRELFLPIMRRVFAASHETPPVRVAEVLLGVPFEEGDRCPRSPGESWAWGGTCTRSRSGSSSST